MTVREALTQVTQQFKEVSIDAPAADAGAIICHVLGCDRVYLYSHGEEPVSPDSEEKIGRLAAERIQRKPLQHILGSKEFMSLNFLVSPEVLIPRPDTETLVETVIRHCRGLNIGSEINILDVGTGSGCIAVSLAKFIKNSRITAVDLSEGALEIARKNSMLNKTEPQIDFIKSDLFSALEQSSTCREFDIIVSNPPYIRSGDIPGLEPEVSLHEPLLALDGGTDGLRYYRSIISRAPAYLRSGGLMALETGYDQSGTVAEMMSEGFGKVHVVKDISDIGRVVCGIKIQDV